MVEDIVDVLQLYSICLSSLVNICFYYRRVHCSDRIEPDYPHLNYVDCSNV